MLFLLADENFVANQNLATSPQRKARLLGCSTSAPDATDCSAPSNDHRLISMYGRYRYRERDISDHIKHMICVIFIASTYTDTPNHSPEKSGR